MPGSIILRNAVDAYTSSKYPTKNYTTLNKMYLEAGTTDVRQGWLFWGMPFPRGVAITNGKLRVWNPVAWPGTITLSVSRISSAWSTTRITHNTRPGAVAPTPSVTKTNAPAWTMWEIDVSAIMQAFADGAPAYGVRLNINSTSGNHWVPSTQYPNHRPELEVAWTEAPQAPETLSPSNGRSVSVSEPTLSFDFTDHAGDTSLQACRVQISNTNNFSTGITWDSNTDFPSGVPIDVPQLDLSRSDLTYAGMTEDQVTYWRVQVQDGAGLWSQWSAVTSMTRDSFGTLTITNPASGATPYVEEPTPPITWTYTGHTQKAYQLILSKPDSSVILWTSGKITSTSQAVTVPAGYLTDTAATYRITVRVWDEITREAEGGRPAYTETYRDFIYQLTNTVTVVSAFDAAQDNPWPWVKLVWTRGTAPDYYVIVRNGIIIDANVTPSEALVSGTSYAYIDQLAPPRQSLTYEVRCVVNGRTSSGNPTDNVTPNPKWSWLMRLDATDPIALLKLGSEKSPVVDPQSSTLQEMYEPVGGANPVLVTQYLRGYQGHVTAVLSDDILPGVSARTQRDRYKQFTREIGSTLLLYWVDEAMKIVPYNMIYQPQAYSGGKIRYVVEFDFFEVT